MAVDGMGSDAVGAWSSSIICSVFLVLLGPRLNLPSIGDDFLSAVGGGKLPGIVKPLAGASLGGGDRERRAKFVDGAVGGVVGGSTGTVVAGGRVSAGTAETGDRECVILSASEEAANVFAGR